MIVRILNNSREEIGFYNTISRDSYKMKNDEKYHVTNYLVLPQEIAGELRNENKHDSLDIADSENAYGVYDNMTEEDIAWWLLKI